MLCSHLHSLLNVKINNNINCILTAFTDACDVTRVPTVSSVRRRRRQRPIADAGRHTHGPESALPGLVTVAHVRDIRGGDGGGRFGQGRLRAVGQHHGATVQQAQPALPSQVQRIAVGQPHGTAAQDCTKVMNNMFKCTCILLCSFIQIFVYNI